MTKEYPQHHIDCRTGDVAPTVFLPGDPGRVPVWAELMDEAWKVAEKREYVTYTGRKNGVLMSCTSTGIGCPSASIAAEELYRIGAKNLIRIGTCGSIQEYTKPGEMIVATGAVRGEHTSEEYISMEYPAVADYRIVRALIDAAEGLEVPYHRGIIRSHDAFYMESPEAFGDYRARIQKWTDANVLALENESSAIFVIASMSKIRAGTILAAGNAIWKPDADAFDWERHVKMMLRVAIRAGVLLDERGLA